MSLEKSVLSMCSQALKMFFKLAKLWTDASKSLILQQLFLNSSLTISNVHLVHSGYASSLFSTELARQMIPSIQSAAKDFRQDFSSHQLCFQLPRLQHTRSSDQEEENSKEWSCWSPHNSPHKLNQTLHLTDRIQ